MTTTEERLSHLEGAYAHVATKGDVGELRADTSELKGELKAEMGELRADMSELKGELKAEMGELRADMSELKGELKAEMGELRADMSELRAELTKEMGNHLKWMIGLQLAGLTAVAAIVRFLT